MTLTPHFVLATDFSCSATRGPRRPRGATRRCSYSSHRRGLLKSTHAAVDICLRVMEFPKLATSAPWLRLPTVVAALLASLVAGCGSTAGTSTSGGSHYEVSHASAAKVLTPLHPPGFTATRTCPQITAPGETVCFTRHPSIVLAKPGFVSLLHRIHLTPSQRVLYCIPPKRYPTPRLQLSTCLAWATRGSSHLQVSINSVLLAGPQDAKPTNRKIANGWSGTTLSVTDIGTATPAS
jgi:hypothetical protein